jgi:hypothetical protein
MVVSPMVLPEQIATFEEFAYAYFDAHPDEYPPNAGTSAFGRGIWNVSEHSPYPDHRVHDTSGVRHNSTRVFVAPILQIVAPSLPRRHTQDVLMMNTRSMEAICELAQDRILDCAETRVHFNETCAMLTTITGGKERRQKPSALVVEPIFAADDPRVVVGFVTATIDFSELLQERISPSTKDIMLVISVHELTLSYKIEGGKVIFLGEGDLHDPYGDKYKRTANLKEGIDGVAHCDPMNYDFMFYPTQDFQKQYQSSFRWIFCFGSVVVIMFVSIVFVTYDFAMVRFSNEQKAVLETKRQFVRFISHEVRTPLNAVSMASDLLRDQVSLFNPAALLIACVALSLCDLISLSGVCFTLTSVIIFFNFSACTCR